MSQFWLDDDDDVDVDMDTGNAAAGGGSGGGGLVTIESSSLSSQQQHPSQSQSQSQQQQQQQQQHVFACTNCGSTDFYYDAVAGRDVCQDCFTQQSQQQSQEAAEHQQQQHHPSSQLLDFEDVMELAAKTRGGTLITTTTTATAATSRKKRKRSTTTTIGQQQQQTTTKQPLEELDQSVPLPDLETCLEAFTHILKVCTRLLARRIGQQQQRRRLSTTAAATAVEEEQQQQQQQQHLVETSLLQTVQQLWVAYLCAFGHGAEYYGRLCPEMRISLRDAFCAYSGRHRTMILAHLTYRAEQEIRREKEEEASDNNNSSSSSSSSMNSKKKKKKNPAEESTAAKAPPAAAASTKTNNQDDSTPQNSATAVDATTTTVRAATATSTATPTGSTSTAAPPTSTTNAHRKGTKKTSTKKKKKKKSSASSASSKQSGAAANMKTSYWNRVINASTRNRREGYKEAALKIKPSMEFICVMMWLAVCESGLVASSDLVQWIADGYFPLWNAMILLPAPLQRKLRPIRTFFRLSGIPSPHYLETNGTILAVACRMKAQESSLDTTNTATHAHTQPRPNSNRVKRVAAAASAATKTTEELVFWSTVCLPMVVTRLVANSGLDQGVLNRSLALMNLPVPNTTQAQHTTRQRLPKPLIIEQEPRATLAPFTRNEDILAVIGIACMMDSTWRRRPYRRGVKVPSSVPYNEAHFAMLDSASLKEYLDFAEANVFDDKGKSWVWGGFDDLLHETKQMQSKADWENDSFGNEDNRDSDDSSSSPVVKPCPVIAGQTLFPELPRTSLSSSLHSNRTRREQEVVATEWIGTSAVTDDVRRSLLIDFLAYSANAKASRVRERMDLFLSSLRKSV